MNGNGPPEAFTHRQVIDKILNRLAEAEQPLPSSLEFYRKVLTTQSKTRLPALSPSITKLKEKAPQRLGQGKPMLAFQDMVVDWADIQKLFQEVTKLTNEYLQPTQEEADELNEIGTDLTLFKETAKIWFGIRTTSRKSTSKTRDINPLTGSVLQASLYPLLAAYTDELLSLVEQDSWYQRYCPICGGSPDFSFLDKERGARLLLCSRCDAQWLYYRLVCPYCSNDDHDTLGYLTDDNGLYRLYTCEKCRHYIKAIDLRKAESEILLPLERILTLDMDRQAYESNYKATG